MKLKCYSVKVMPVGAAFAMHTAFTLKNSDVRISFPNWTAILI